MPQAQNFKFTGYTFCPFTLPEITLASIKDRLGSRFGKIYFVAGEALYDQFRPFCPDYFSDESVVLGKYMEEIEGNLGNPEALQEIAQEFGIGSIRNTRAKDLR